jgi:hypothetical protein
VFRNWKSGLFHSQQSSKSRRNGNGAVEKLTESAIVPETKEIALKFFQWLSKFLQSHCDERELGDLRQIPIRLNVPAFENTVGSHTERSPAESALLSILVESGFCVDKACPIVTEPESNAIGIYTGGNNSTSLPQGPKGPRRMHFQKMFERGGYLPALRQRFLTNSTTSHHRVLVVDIGAFTTDFALLEFALVEDAPRPRIHCHSHVLGIQNLDAAVLKALPPEKATKIEAMDARRREEMKRSLYTTQAPYQLDSSTIIGAEKEAKSIQSRIREFSRELVSAMDAFLADRRAKKVNEVILTGGGNAIPLVSSGLQEHVLNSRLGTTLFHTPSTVPVPSNPRFFHHSLKTKLVRGASGIGGASVYFEPAYS